MSADWLDRLSKCRWVSSLKWLLTPLSLIWGCPCCRSSMTRIFKLEWLKPASPSPYLGIQRNGLISKTAEQPTALIGVHGNCWMLSTFEKSGHLCKQLIVAVRAWLRHLVLQKLDVTLPRNPSKPGIWPALIANQSGGPDCCLCFGNSPWQTGMHPNSFSKMPEGGARAACCQSGGSSLACLRLSLCRPPGWLRGHVLGPLGCLGETWATPDATGTAPAECLRGEGTFLSVHYHMLPIKKCCWKQQIYSVPI